MKVVLLTRDYPPSIGGIATHASSLAVALRRLGVEVDVVVGETDSKTLVLPAVRSFKGYDLVHVQSSPYGAFVRGAPLVVTVHAPVRVEWNHYSLLSKAKSAPAVLFEKATFRRAKAILAVSETTISNLATRYGIERRRITLIGNGVDYSKFSKQTRANKRGNLILLVSRLEPRKNITGALRALSLLPEGSYEARIAGDGSQMSYLLRQAKSLGVKIKFLGKVSHDSLVSLYQDAGIFLTTSQSEGFGLSVLEAMAAGCAVVASNIPTHGDIIGDGRNGLIYRDQSDLVTKLRSLLYDPDMTKRLGGAARDRAKEFSWESVARRTLSAYNKCLSSDGLHGGFD